MSAAPLPPAPRPPRRNQSPRQLQRSPPPAVALPEDVDDAIDPPPSPSPSPPDLVLPREKREGSARVDRRERGGCILRRPLLTPSPSPSPSSPPASGRPLPDTPSPGSTTASPDGPEGRGSPPRLIVDDANRVAEADHTVDSNFASLAAAAAAAARSSKRMRVGL